MLFEPYVRFHILIKLGYNLGIAAHSAYDRFSRNKYQIVILVFPIPRFLEWEFISDCASLIIAYLYLLMC